MFERFLGVFASSGGDVAAPAQATVDACLEAAGGRSFADGLYRVHTRTSASASDALVADAFPELAGRLACFGYDWLGRQFATDAARGASDVACRRARPSPVWCRQPHRSKSARAWHK